MEAVARSASSYERGHARDYGRVFVVLLLGVFALALLLSVLVGTGAYRSLNDAQARTDDARLALDFISNSVHANDATDAVAVGEGPEGRSLVLVERLDSGAYETRTYLYQGQIVQEYALEGAPYMPEKATRIAPSSTFDFSFAHGLLSITTDFGQSDVALRSLSEGA